MIEMGNDKIINSRVLFKHTLFIKLGDNTLLDNQQQLQQFQRQQQNRLI